MVADGAEIGLRLPNQISRGRLRISTGLETSNRPLQKRHAIAHRALLIRSSQTIVSEGLVMVRESPDDIEYSVYGWLNPPADLSPALPGQPGRMLRLLAGGTPEWRQRCDWPNGYRRHPDRSRILRQAPHATPATSPPLSPAIP